MRSKFESRLSGRGQTAGGRHGYEASAERTEVVSAREPKQRLLLVETLTVTLSTSWGRRSCRNSSSTSCERGKRERGKVIRDKRGHTRAYLAREAV